MAYRGIGGTPRGCWGHKEALGHWGLGGVRGVLGLAGSVGTQGLEGV